MRIQIAARPSRSKLGLRCMLPPLKTILFALITLLAGIVLWPFWPSRPLQEFALLLSIRLLPLLAIVYGTLALADYIHDRWRKGLL
jgi:hypothetical protein